VGAHYDTAGEQPGADDNASGVAGLIELAHVLGNTVLPVCVELVAFTLEESASFRTNQMGSAVHAQSLRITEQNPYRLDKNDHISCSDKHLQNSSRSFVSKSLNSRVSSSA
jgi:Zn-dependent M28 family amino/carboxypeptidase